MSLRVNTIYPAFMGEVNPYGIGAKCVFIRLAGCNIRCYKKTFGVLCDTPEALEMDSGDFMEEIDIVNEVRKHNVDLVCLTGGEPLLQKVSTLITELGNVGINVVIETNGSVRIANYIGFRNVSIILDIKGPSTGEAHTMLESNYSLMRSNDYFKFVIYDEEDYQFMKEFYENLDNPHAHRTAGLFWGSKMSYMDLQKKIFEDDLPIDLNMQIHKMGMLYDEHRENVDSILIPRNL